MNEQRYKRIVMVAAIVAVASIGIAGAILGTRGLFNRGLNLSGEGQRGTIVVDEEKVFETGSLKELELYSTSADINVVIGDTLKVRLHGTVRTANQNNIPELGVDQSPDTLSVGSKPRRSGIGFFSSNLALSVELPESYDGEFSLRSVSGSLSLPFGGYAVLDAHTTSGEIDLSNIRANVFKVDSTSGDITLRDINSVDFNADTTSGDIRVSGKPGKAKVESTSGKIELKFDELTEDLDISGTSGDVEVRLPGDASFDLNARSTSGDIKCLFPITVDGATRAGRNTLNGTVGDGGLDISIRTVSGDIRVEK